MECREEKGEVLVPRPEVGGSILRKPERSRPICLTPEDAGRDVNCLRRYDGFMDARKDIMA